MAIITRTASMSPKQYRNALAKLALTQERAAEMLGVSIRASNGYANGRPIPAPVDRLLTLILRLGLTPEDVASKLRKKR
jgi:transcriptional regulator with XRE-family HTH domain